MKGRTLSCYFQYQFGVNFTQVQGLQTQNTSVGVWASQHVYPGQQVSQPTLYCLRLGFPDTPLSFFSPVHKIRQILENQKDEQLCSTVLCSNHLGGTLSPEYQWIRGRAVSIDPPTLILLQGQSTALVLCAQSYGSSPNLPLLLLGKHTHALGLDHSTTRS